MIKIVATFDVPYYEYDVDGYQAKQVTTQLEKAEGVERVCFLRAMEGNPRFALEVECADDAVESATDQLNRMMSQYASYIADLSVRTFRQLA